MRLVVSMFLFYSSSHSIPIIRRKSLLSFFSRVYFIIRDLRYFPLLVVPLVRRNTAAVATTWTNALGGRVAVLARRASITNTNAATSASARSATWANIATWNH